MYAIYERDFDGHHPTLLAISDKTRDEIFKELNLTIEEFYKFFELEEIELNDLSAVPKITYRCWRGQITLFEEYDRFQIDKETYHVDYENIRLSRYGKNKEITLIWEAPISCYKDLEEFGKLFNDKVSEILKLGHQHWTIHFDKCNSRDIKINRNNGGFILEIPVKEIPKFELIRDNGTINIKWLSDFFIDNCAKYSFQKDLKDIISKYLHEVFDNTTIPRMKCDIHKLLKEYFNKGYLLNED
ncbi:MAG: hypothetical protein WC783_04425 [Candidatus Paceibacterota bacterium]|jgi:hypothetical protein